MSSISFLSFNDYRFNFCESKIYRGSPEYINSFTSLFLSYYGFKGLINNHHTNIPLKMLYVSLFICGFSSFGFHWTGNIGWAFLDQFSMVLIALSSLIAMTSEIINSYKHVKTLKENSNNMTIMLLLIVIYILLIITFNSLGNDIIFNFLFALFLLSSILFIPITKYVTHRELITNCNLIYKYGIIAIVCLISSMLIWIITESLCDTISWMKYFQGHAIWHFGTGYGGYLLGTYILFLNENRNPNTAYLNIKNIFEPFIERR